MAFETKALLQPPIARAAYSDRMAWLLAEMSRLAYEKFEGNPELLDSAADRLAKTSDREAIRKELAAIAQKLVAPGGPGLRRLTAQLAEAGFELVQTFNSSGTQAFLAKREQDRIVVLAFRGTEADAKDIKTDLNARFYVRNGVKVHTGFRDAYAAVEAEVKQAVRALPSYSLYVTGHSLGGALALIATRSLNSDNLAACYTYGSPKVGDQEFGEAIKPPIYRVVNAADAVPRVPPGWTLEILIVAAHLVPVPYLRDWLIRVLQGMRGYRHQGDMRYLSACKEDFSDLHVLSNPEQFDRTVWLVKRVLRNYATPFLDHRIAEYCSKLERYALSRIDAK